MRPSYQFWSTRRVNETNSPFFSDSSISDWATKLYLARAWPSVGFRMGMTGTVPSFEIIWCINKNVFELCNYRVSVYRVASSIRLGKKVTTHIYILDRQETDCAIVLALIPVLVDLTTNVQNVAFLERELPAIKSCDIHEKKTQHLNSMEISPTYLGDWLWKLNKALPTVPGKFTGDLGVNGIS